MPRVGIPAEVSCDPGRGGVVVFCRATNGIDEPCPRSRTEQARLVERAKIILACLDGKRNDEVSRELGVRPNTVGVWRKRFAARGLAGLRDQRGRVRNRDTVRSCAGAFCGNWSCRRRPGWPVGMVGHWPRRSVFRTPRFGGCCAKTAFSCAGIARGASVPTPSLPRKRRILSACT